MIVLKSTHDKIVDELNSKIAKLNDDNWAKYCASHYVLLLDKITCGDDLRVVEKRHLDKKTYSLCYTNYNHCSQYTFCEYVKMSSKKEAEKWLSKVKQDDEVQYVILTAKLKKIKVLESLSDSDFEWSKKNHKDNYDFFKEYVKAIENVLGND